MQELLVKKDVVLDFASNIDNYCEQIHLTQGIPRYKICQIVVKEFKKDFSEDFIRKNVDSIYKVTHKANNAKKKGKSLLTRLREKAEKLNSEIELMSQESVAYVGKTD